MYSLIINSHLFDDENLFVSGIASPIEKGFITLQLVNKLYSSNFPLPSLSSSFIGAANVCCLDSHELTAANGFPITMTTSSAAATTAAFSSIETNVLFFAIAWTDGRVCLCDIFKEETASVSDRGAVVTVSICCWRVLKSIHFDFPFSSAQFSFIKSNCGNSCYNQSLPNRSPFINYNPMNGTCAGGVNTKHDAMRMSTCSLVLSAATGQTVFISLDLNLGRETHNHGHGREVTSCNVKAISCFNAAHSFEPHEGYIESFCFGKTIF